MSWKALRPIRVAVAKPSDLPRPEPARRKSCSVRRAISKEEHEHRLNARTYSLREAYAQLIEVASHQVSEWQCLLSALDAFAQTAVPFDVCLVRLKERFVKDNRLRHREVEFVLPRKDSTGQLYSLLELREKIEAKANIWQQMYVKAYELKWLVEDAAFTSSIWRINVDGLKRELASALAKNLEFF